MIRSSVRVVTLTIDGREVGAREDQSVLDVAREQNIFIPTLCDLPGLSTAAGFTCCFKNSHGISSFSQVIGTGYTGGA